MIHLLGTERGLEGDLHLDQLEDGAASLCLCCDRLKRVLVIAWYSSGDGEMDRGGGKAIAVRVDDDADLLSTCSGTKFAMPSSLTNDMVKQAA